METARHWRLNNQRLKMQGLICEECKTVTFQPHGECEICLDKKHQEIYRNHMDSQVKSATEKSS